MGIEMGTTQYTNIELGNLLFGHSRGNYPMSRDMKKVISKFSELLDIIESDMYGYTSNKEFCNVCGGYENDVFVIRPYYWGDDENEFGLPNFELKDGSFSFSWYKYPFRDSYMSHNLKEEKIVEILEICIRSVTRR